MMEKLVMTAPDNPTENIRQRINKLALIDADFLKYYVCGDVASYIKREGHHPQMKYGVDYLERFVQKRLEEHFYSRWDNWGNIFVFSGPTKNTFRYNVGFTKEYKGNRGVTPPSYEEMYRDLAQVVGIVSRNNPTYIHPEYEADDIVSVLQNEHTYIYSHDKDLKQVAGNHYDIKKNVLHSISTEESIKFLAQQLLTGDSTDNIPGVEGIGEKSAFKRLNGLAIKSMIPEVYTAYINKYGMIEGTDRFAECWLLVKMRFDRKGYESHKLTPAFTLRDKLLKNRL